MHEINVVNFFFQMLISGARVPIDVEDLRTHTSYSGIVKDIFPIT